MNIKKRFLAAVLSVSVISACSLAVLSDNLLSKSIVTYVSAVPEFYYTTQSGNAFITGYNGSAADVVVPAVIDDHPVTKIKQEAFANKTRITSVVLPDSIELIEDKAFYGCTSLTSVNMPASLTKIGDFAFSQTNIASLDLPDGLTEIGGAAFSSCTNLSSVIIPESIKTMYPSIFSGCTNLTAASLPDNLTEIPNYAFNNCEKLETISIPESVQIIGQNAFSGCKVLSEVILPPELTQISESTFQNCINIQSVDVPDNVEIIGKFAFQGCVNLQTINTSPALSAINEGAFKGCTNLLAIDLTENMTYIGKNAFRSCTALQSVNIPEGVTFLGESAFQDCTGLKEASLPDSMTDIPVRAFYNCSALDSVLIPESITNVCTKAFYQCNSLSLVSMPGVITIDSLAFTYCSALSTIELPKVVSVGTSAFADCKNLESIEINPDSELDVGVFDNCSMLQYINSIKVTLVDENGCPYFDEKLESYVMDNFRSDNNTGFINSYIEYETKYIVGQVTSDSMTDIEKAAALHDWVCNKVDYDYSEEVKPENGVDSAIFLNDLAVCEGYAHGYCLLLQAAGIESYYISGTAADSGEGHMWNIIKLDDHYFHVDCCWDDITDTKYGYFLLNDEQISESRYGWVLNTPTSVLYQYVQDKLPVCTYAIGDVNKDGSSDSSDAALLQKYLVNKSEIASGDSVLANPTHDGNVNVFDVISLKRTSLDAE